jgi:hypothetical protein
MYTNRIMTMMTKLRSLGSNPEPKISSRRTLLPTTSCKFFCPDEVDDKSGICEHASSRAADAKPERCGVGETVVMPVHNAKDGDDDDVDDV